MHKEVQLEENLKAPLQSFDYDIVPNDLFLEYGP